MQILALHANDLVKMSRQSASSTKSSVAHPSSPMAKQESSAHSTPPSSPPDTTGRSAEHKNGGNTKGGVSASMQAEEDRMAAISTKEETERENRLAEKRKEDLAGGQAGVDSKYKALEYLLSQSKLYSSIMLQQMQNQEEVDEKKGERAQKKAAKREEKAEQAALESQRRSTRNATTSKNAGDEDQEAPVSSQGESTQKQRGRGRPPIQSKKQSGGKISDYMNKNDLKSKASNGQSVKEALEEEAAQAEEDGVKASDIGIQNMKSARQPDLVTGGMMRGYQLEGLEWLISLYENGLNGILADEMGLGKTIQTISFLAFLREKGTYGPFLISAPLSTTTNWVDEFQRWTPDIPVVLYHGSKQEREDIRRKRLKNPTSPDFPVVCTSYEICMNDRKFLAHYGWKFIIIDEGHRIKNLNCRLIRELQSYQSANRLLITGTPLQNNLTELWSLLHFLMPEIFDKLESFESWFDFSALKERGGHHQILSEERKKNLVTSLHAILKPFLLRRVKTDVEHSLPKKREYVLYAPLSSEQRELYQEILSGNSRSYLEEKVFETLSLNGSGASTPVSGSRSVSATKRKAPSRSSTPNKSVKTSRDSTPAANGNTQGRSRRGKGRKSYEEVSDRKYFKKLEEGGSENDGEQEVNSEEEAEQERAATFALAKKQVAQKKLQNPIMQLRLCCNSPHNFYDPFPDAEEGDSAVDYGTIVTSSGKMLLLDRLLGPLFKNDHKVLIFSQFKTQLDILDLYFNYVRKTPVCRIDGSVANVDRQEQIRLFNNSKKHRIFLLSTRAGGQGINLAAADTVILFDSDWNPQQDLQAQDRAHRIGQTRNVIVYRLATRGTVEEMLLEKADGKRRLEKLVIQKGRFKSWATERRQKGTKSGEDDADVDEDGTIEELRGLLARDDGEKFDLAAGTNAAGIMKVGEQLLSKEQLAILTDRSEDAYSRAEQGVDVGGGEEVFKAVETKSNGGGLLESLSK